MVTPYSELDSEARTKIWDMISRLDITISLNPSDTYAIDQKARLEAYAQT